MKLALAPAARSVTPALPPVRGRGAWTPAPVGPYRLPRAVEIRLVAALEGFRNRDAALELAVHLARVWCSPKNFGKSFPICRRALAERSSVDLSEARVRGALGKLEKAGFFERVEVDGRRYRRSETGWQRRPVLWRIGAAFLATFAQANAKARRAQAAASARPAAPGLASSSPSVTVPGPATAAPLIAHKQNRGSRVLMGEQHPRPPAADADSPLEAVLGRLEAGVFGGVRRGRGG